MRGGRLCTVAVALAVAFVAAIAALGTFSDATPRVERGPAPVAFAPTAPGVDAAVLRAKPGQDPTAELRTTTEHSVPAAMLVAAVVLAAGVLALGSARLAASRRAMAARRRSTPSRGPPSFRLVHAH
jgi:hypothetical protein